MERCNSNRCGCNRRGMMNTGRPYAGSMRTDYDRRDNSCDSMCGNSDNDVCMKDADNKCSQRENMDIRNRRDDNMRSDCMREPDMGSDCRRENNMRRDCRRENNMRRDCRRENNMRRDCRRENSMRCGCETDNDMSSRCGRKDDMEGFAVAMAYVPWQQWNEIYPLNTGLQRGTIFPELDKPFFKGRCCNL